MTRGHQKLQAQKRNQLKQEQIRKAQGSDQKSAAAALVHTCSVCKAQMPDPKTYRQHYENKHPKSPMPPELEGVVA